MSEDLQINFLLNHVTSWKYTSVVRAACFFLAQLHLSEIRLSCLSLIFSRLRFVFSRLWLIFSRLKFVCTRLWLVCSFNNDHFWWFSGYCNFYSERHMHVKVKDFMNLVFSDLYSKKKFFKKKCFFYF